MPQLSKYHLAQDTCVINSCTMRDQFAACLARMLNEIRPVLPSTDTVPPRESCMGLSFAAFNCLFVVAIMDRLKTSMCDTSVVSFLSLFSPQYVQRLITVRVCTFRNFCGIRSYVRFEVMTNWWVDASSIKGSPVKCDVVSRIDVLR